MSDFAAKLDAGGNFTSVSINGFSVSFTGVTSLSGAPQSETAHAANDYRGAIDTDTGLPDDRAVVITQSRWALGKIFGEPVEGVKLTENSMFARLHGAIATTRPNRIYTVLSERQFLANGRLALEEYFHVLRQWNTGELTRSGYLIESFRNGYLNNRFEVVAKGFARQNVAEYNRLVGR